MLYILHANAILALSNFRLLKLKCMGREVVVAHSVLLAHRAEAMFEPIVKWFRKRLRRIG